MGSNDRDFKDQGNRLFLAKRYEDAIACYSKAIAKNSSIPQYFTNRALCYLKLGRWTLAGSDCRTALDLDPTWVKGHFFLGQALMEQDHCEEAVKHLQRAHDLAKEQRLNFGDDISSQLRLARKRRFTQQEEQRVAQEIELQMYLNRLIREDRDKQIEEISKGKEYSEVEDQISDIEIKTDRYIAELNDLFAKVDERRTKRDVPDFLCGKISFEIMKDPVITPSGITYDRKDIEEHLQRVGHFDPVTRVKLTKDQLIPNFVMKEVIDAFLLENEWALHC
nr:EOG090X0AJZ [Cyclestheria hislopi]